MYEAVSNYFFDQIYLELILSLGYDQHLDALIQKQCFSVGGSLKHFWEEKWTYSAVKD